MAPSVSQVCTELPEIVLPTVPTLNKTFKGAALATSPSSIATYLRLEGRHDWRGCHGCGRERSAVLLQASTWVDVRL